MLADIFKTNGVSCSWGNSEYMFGVYPGMQKNNDRSDDNLQVPNRSTLPGRIEVIQVSFCMAFKLAYYTFGCVSRQYRGRRTTQ